MCSAPSTASLVPGPRPGVPLSADGAPVRAPPFTDGPVTVPLFVDVDPVLVGIIAVLLLVVFVFFLLIRKVITSFTEGMREGRR